MKGFTLIEVILYMALSSMLCISMVSFSILLIDTQSLASNTVDTETSGLTLMRMLETNTKNKVPIEPLLESASSSLRNFTKTTTQSITTLSFTLNNHDFNLSFTQQ
jgi:type II secretory pathway pseudopilin PulG